MRRLWDDWIECEGGLERKMWLGMGCLDNDFGKDGWVRNGDN